MSPVPSSHVLLVAIWKWAAHPFRQITQLLLRSSKCSEISFPSLHYSFLSRRRRNRKTVITCWYIWITEIEVKRITLADPWPAMVINCCVKLTFKATPRIKKCCSGSNSVSYTYAQYLIFWIWGVLTSSEFNEVDHPQIVREWVKLFQGRGEGKTARQRLVNDAGTQERTSASFLACSGWFRPCNDSPRSNRRGTCV